MSQFFSRRIKTDEEIRTRRILLASSQELSKIKKIVDL